MREDIIKNIDNPGHLEKLFRENRWAFKREFLAIYSRIDDKPLADYWYERLHYENDGISWGVQKDVLFIIGACLVAGLLAKIPAVFQISEEFFYPRNIGFVVFPLLTAFFAWKNNLSLWKLTFIGSVSLLAVVYINALPNNPESDTLVLACIHLPFLLWGLFGVSYAGECSEKESRYLQFLQFNGEVAVMAALLIIGCVLTTGITIGLFELIGLDIEQFYFEYVVPFGLPSVPIVAVYLTRTNPQLVNKVSPVIAKIFSPLVLVMLVIYLGAIIFSGKDPYHDRDFLILFNLLLIGVMTLIFFSVSTRENSVSATWILLLLSLVTLVVNGIALSAILFRISEWGFTPNRLAVLGGNLLILVHLFIVTVGLFRGLRSVEGTERVEKLVVQYLPVYFVWAVVVIFLFPVLFGFK